MFNSNPGNAKVVEPDKAGAWPVVKADSTHAGLGAGSVDIGMFEGFVGNGDFISLTDAHGALQNIDYFSNVGVSPANWPINVTDINAVHTEFLGFCLDKNDALLYTATRGATLTEFAFASIDVAGTITNIATVTVTQPSAGTDWAWAQTGSPVNLPGACSFHRVADGSGDFRMYITSNPSTVTEEIIFDVAGSLVQDTVTVARMSRGVDVLYHAPLHYKTPNGTFIGYFEQVVGGGVLIGIGRGPKNNFKYAQLEIPLATGIFSHLPNGTDFGAYPMLWKGNVALVYWADGLQGPRYIAQAEFNRWADALAIAAGVA